MHRSIHPCIDLFILAQIYSSMHRYIHPCIDLFIHAQIYSSMHRSINSFINLFIHPFISDGFPQVPVQLLLPHGLQGRRGNQVVVVVVYQCSISNVMSLGNGDIEALKARFTLCQNVRNTPAASSTYTIEHGQISPETNSMDMSSRPVTPNDTKSEFFVEIKKISIYRYIFLIFEFFSGYI